MKNKKLWKIHNWVGLYAGIVIAFLSLTGSLAVFIPEIEWLLSKEYEVNPGSNGNVEWGAVQVGLQKKFSEYSFYGIEIPDSPDRPYNYLFFHDDDGGFKAQVAYVNPYNGDLLGITERNNTIPNFLRQIHVRLYDGLYGRQIVGLAGIALIFSTITGLIIYGNFMKRQVFGSIRSGRGVRIASADWHKLVGISALLFNVVIAFTGAWLGLQPKLMDWFDMEVPNRYATERVVRDREKDTLFPIDVDQALAIAMEKIPDFIPKRIQLSANGSGTVTVLGNVRGGIYEQASNKVVLDKASLEPLFIYDIRSQSFGDQMYYVQEALHFGNFGGMTLKILYAFLGLTTGFLSITGFIIFLKRKETNADKKFKTEKVVFIYCMGGLLFFILTGFFTLTIGYSIISKIITYGVYIFLAIFISIQLINLIKKKQQKSKDEPTKAVQ
jgi:uncharacterized iron-regulated membrane protein